MHKGKQDKRRVRGKLIRDYVRKVMKLKGCVVPLARENQRPKDTPSF
jgi:hypothetical protein